MLQLAFLKKNKMIWIISYFTILSLSFWSLFYVLPETSELSEVSDITKTFGCFIYTCLVHLWLFTLKSIGKNEIDSATIILFGLFYYLFTHVVGLTASINLATFDITNIITFPAALFLYFCTFLLLARENTEQEKKMKESLGMTKQELKNWFLEKLDSLEESQSIVDYLERLEEIKKEIKTK